MLSFQVYDQLDSLAKHNPWFVQSLQNIMASTQTADASKPKLPTAAAPAVRPVPAPPAGSDPAQAALILLLAGKVTNPNHSAAQNAALLGKIVKQLETGVSAADILKGLVTDEKAEEAEVRPTGFPPANRPILLQTPPTASASSKEGQSKGDLNSIISNLAKTVPKMLNGVVRDLGDGQGQSPPQAAETKHKKNPQLMELLFKSYQARVKNGIYNPNQNRSWRPPSNTNTSNARSKISSRTTGELSTITNKLIFFL